MSHKNLIDLMGQWFGPWCVIMREEGGKDARWRLAHEYFVGLTVVSSGYELRVGHVPHLLRHPLCKRSASMVQRCYNPNQASYRTYGAEGVRVYEPWLVYGSGGLAYFLAEELGSSRPPEGHHIDRINSVKGYEPGNIRWLPGDENSRLAGKNRKAIKRYTIEELTTALIHLISKEALPLYLQTL